jgi:DNA repair protein RadC|tara:strand:+ start:436 stop:624 length:189 start_codon:yes stop_codon:yes gene_type:complete
MDEAVAAVPVAGKQPSYIADHRQRLRARFMTGGANATPEYELLELILFALFQGVMLSHSLML